MFFCSRRAEFKFSSTLSDQDFQGRSFLSIKVVVSDKGSLVSQKLKPRKSCWSLRGLDSSLAILKQMIHSRLFASAQEPT